MNDLRAIYKKLLNETLPATYTCPVKFNHCFNRIVLDWLFQDCWYNYLNKNKTAISQLSPQQLQLAIDRMNQWLQHQQLLVADNEASLHYRKKVRKIEGVACNNAKDGVASSDTVL